jgi:hypothetical protein
VFNNTIKENLGIWKNNNDGGGLEFVGLKSIKEIMKYQEEKNS